jgi:hypothetical protein
MQWIENLIGSYGFVKVGESVATVAFDLANRLMCNPIILVGQDLAYSDGKPYAFSVVEEDIKQLNKFTTLEMLYRERLMNGEEKPIVIDRVGGGKVLTTPKLYECLRWFESQVAESRATCINATGARGAKIGGTKEMKLRDAIREYCKAPIKVKRILREILQSPQRKNITPLLNGFHRLISESLRVKEICEEGVRSAEDAISELESTEVTSSNSLIQSNHLFRTLLKRQGFFEINRWCIEPLLYKVRTDGRKVPPLSLAKRYKLFFHEIKTLSESLTSKLKEVSEKLQNQ